MSPSVHGEMSVRRLRWHDVWRSRLIAHSLLDPSLSRSVTRVAGDVCGIHAQVMASAELSLGLRVNNASQATVRDALWKRRTLVKTAALRGTIHLLPAHELGLWLAARRAAPRPDQTKRLEFLRLSHGQVDRIVEAIAVALDGQRLTTERLEDEVARRVGMWALERTGDAFGSGQSRVRTCIGYAAHAGVLIYGPNEGNRVTYVRPEQWLGRATDDIHGEEALREVLRRYLRAYGPSTPGDFAPWFQTTASSAQKLFRSLGEELEEVDVEGSRAWWVRGTRVDETKHERRVALLPEFDCYLVGCRPRDALVPPSVQEIGASRGLKRFHFHSPIPILLIDGVVAGIWRRRKERSRVALTVEPFGRITKWLRGSIDAEVERISRILETQIDLSIGPMEVRPYFGPA